MPPYPHAPHLRLLALPLTRSSRQQPLFTLLAIPPAASPPSSRQTPAAPPPPRLSLANASRLTKQSLDKAAQLWDSFGAAPRGGWKRRTWEIGERLMDRVEYEEWALKGLDPELGPQLSRAGKAEGKEVLQDPEEKLPILYPPSLLAPQPLLSTLKDHLAHRGPHHKKLMTRCLVISPFLIPFALVPVIPNFPLFYVLWRAWSHYRALKSSQYLLALLSSHRLLPTPSATLDKVYTSERDRDDRGEEGDGRVLLSEEGVEELVKAFGLDQARETEVRRAVGQARVRLGGSGKEEEKEKEKED